MITDTRYLIVGAGLTGLSAAYHLARDYYLVEKSGSPGGTAGSLHHRGFKLDNSVHVLYFKNEYISNWLRSLLNIELIEVERKASVWVYNSFVRFPLQYHLADLPISSRTAILKSLLKSTFIGRKNHHKNFEEYSESSFGDSITNFLVRPYNEKLFGVPISELGLDWLGDYIPRYSNLRMILSAFVPDKTNYGRNSRFFYPAEGGIGSVASRISSKLSIVPSYNNPLEKIMIDQRIAILANQSKVKFDHLISTIPLDELMQKIDPLPDEVVASVNQLKKNSTTLLHVLGKGRIQRGEHWIYVPDPSIPFYRVTIPGNINPSNCSNGNFALTLEFGGNVYNDEQVLVRSLEALKKMGFAGLESGELEYQWKLLDCGYVIYDKNRTHALKKIFNFLVSNRIWSTGRYGKWEYSNMEAALIHGKNIAEKVNGFIKK